MRGRGVGEVPSICFRSRNVPLLSHSVVNVQVTTCPPQRFGVFGCVFAEFDEGNQEIPLASVAALRCSVLGSADLKATWTDN